MEKLSIQDASYRLNLSQADIRECIRNGELKASREAGPAGRRWMVELPEDCLLYTSPSPRDVEESRMPSSA